MTYKEQKEQRAKRIEEEKQKELQKEESSKSLDLSTLFELCEYNPEEIGIVLLRASGFLIDCYMSGDIAIRDKNGKFLNFIDHGGYVE